MRTKQTRLHTIREKLESMKEVGKNLPTPSNPEQQSHLDEISKEINDLGDYINQVIHHHENKIKK